MSDPGLREGPPAPPIRSLRELRERAGRLPSVPVAIAGARGETVLDGALAARTAGFVEPVLVGPVAELEAYLADREDGRGVRVVDADDDGAAATAAVALAREGEAAILAKGTVPTATLLRAVLDPVRGLRTGRLLSDVFLFDFPHGAEARLVGITDGGINPSPTVEQRVSIAGNAAAVFRLLGVPRPRIAVLAALERVTDEIPSTREAAEVAARARRCLRGACEVEGPLALDVALSAEAAAAKGLASTVAGRADILLCPDIDAANIVAKAIEYVVPLEPAHLAVGASVPLLLPSRAEGPEARLRSLALGRLAAAGGP